MNPPLLGMRKVVSEDAVRRGLAKIDEAAGAELAAGHLDYCVAPLLDEPWVLDVDTTIKPLYGAAGRCRWSATIRTSPVGRRTAITPT